jgi:multiple sugar transport system permease protein
VEDRNRRTTEVLSRYGRGTRTALYVGVGLGALVMVFPIAWMLLVSLKTDAETVAYPMTWLPRRLNFGSYANVWLLKNFARYFLNSAAVAAVTTLLAMTAAAPAAYGFSRFKYPLSRTLQSFFLTTQMVPGILLVIPYFVMMRAAGLVNSYTSLFLIYTALALPFCTWMLIGFFHSIPKEIDEAALVDGCGRFGVFFRVVLPLAAPGIAATALFAFLVAWKEYLFALALTSEESMYVLTVGIANLFGETRVAWNEVMAAAMLATVPALVFYMFLERHMVRGLTAGAVKG